MKLRLPFIKNPPLVSVIRLSGAIGMAEQRDLTQAWSRALYQSYPQIHGLYYRWSMYPEGFCVALYDRVQNVGALPQRPVFHRSVDDASWDSILQAAARELGYPTVVGPV